MPDLYNSIPTLPGIYKIESLISGNFYIGSSNNMRLRAQKHLHKFKKGINSLIMQKAWDRYGEENIRMSVIEFCPVEILRQREQYYIDTLHPTYNLSKLASGLEMTPEIRKKVSEGLRKRFTPEQLSERTVHMRNSKPKGFQDTEKYKNKLSSAFKKLWKTDEYRNKVLSGGGGNYKLSKEQVLEIRSRYKKGNGASLAREFGVSQPTISAIVTKRNWGDL